MCCLSLGVGGVLLAQPLITGSLRDAQSDEPVPFATIGIKSKSIGVVSNLDGDFQIPQSYQEQGDTLVISCIGYAQEEVPLSGLLIGQINTIRIRKAGYALPEAIVRAKDKQKLSAGQIVRRAIRNIPDNYPQSPFSYLGYYRDYQKKDEDYLNLNEAIVEVFDEGFATDNREQTQLKLYDYKLNHNFTINDSTAIAYDNEVEKFVPNAELTPFGGNELSILLMHDALRNHQVHAYSFVDTFANDFVINHKFKLEEPTVIGEAILHCIAFESRRSVIGSKFQVEGRIYIEVANYAIHKLTYSVYDGTEQERRLLYDIQLEYARSENQMLLNYISFNNLFYLAKPPIFRVEEIFIDTTHSYTGYANNALHDNCIEILLNRPPDPSSALNKDNYNILVDNRKLNIRRITLGGSNSIRIYPEQADMVPIINDIDYWQPLMSFEFGEIYDHEQHKLNEPEYVEIRQYRELFRQKITTSSPSPGGVPFLNRDTTLSANFDLLKPEAGAGAYWMNTPLKQ